MPRGVLAAQVIHAAGESSSNPVPKGTIAVALEASKEQLLSLEKRLIEDNIPHQSIYEPDPPFNGEITAIGVYPDYGDKLRKYFSQFPLVR